VGLGKQTLKDHIPVISEHSELEIVGVVEPDTKLLQKESQKIGCKGFRSLKLALQMTNPDCALVSVPHNEYLSLLTLLAKNHVATLKEKPLAMNLSEAKQIIDLYKKHDTYLQICVQRRFSNLYETCSKLLSELGPIYSAYAEYTLNLKSLDIDDLGWRADKTVSGGGATLDLGYHTIDLLTNLFGKPKKIYAQLNFNSLPGKYTIDDSMKAMCLYDKNINANLFVTKIYDHKGEKIKIFGQKGYLFVDDRTVSLYTRENELVEAHNFQAKEHEVRNQLNYFIESMNDASKRSANDSLTRDQVVNMRIIDAIYESHSKGKVVKI
jgi:predicted dehydrogenase